MTKIKFGLVQTNISWENPKENIKKYSTFFKQAINEAVDVLVFPETCCNGFTNNVDVARISFNYFYNEMCQLAVSYAISVVFGVITPGCSKAQNQCIAISSTGDEIWRYTKIHPFSYANENEFYERGTDLAFGNICGVSCSPFICYDLRFPEIFQVASYKAEVLFVIANWPSVRIEHWDALLKARAIETQSFIIAVNRTGSGNGISYCGHSMSINPEGKIMNTIFENEELITVDIIPEACNIYRNSFKVKQDRNIKLYTDFYHIYG